MGFDIYDIQWEGNQHRGIDDARNTAKLIFQFRDSLRSIFKFSVAESIDCLRRLISRASLRTENEVDIRLVGDISPSVKNILEERDNISKNIEFSTHMLESMLETSHTWFIRITFRAFWGWFII